MLKLPQVIALCGPISSGKTTLAKQLSAATGFRRLSGDEFRESIDPVNHNSRLSAAAFAQMAAEAALWLYAGQSVILDATGASPSYAWVVNHLETMYDTYIIQLLANPKAWAEREPLRTDRKHLDAKMYDYTITSRLGPANCVIDTSQLSMAEVYGGAYNMMVYKYNPPPPAPSCFEAKAELA